MSALSAVQTANTLTPPSSAHGDDVHSWDFTPAKQEKRSYKETIPNNSENANANAARKTHHITKPEHGLHVDRDTASGGSSGGEQLSGPVKKQGSVETGAPHHSDADDADGADDRPENVVDVPFEYDERGGCVQTSSSEGLNQLEDDSKWIHRDLLAKIESQELQAAGISLPPRSRSRSQSRSFRDGSSRRPLRQSSSRSRKNSHTLELKSPDPSEPIAWYASPAEDMEADRDGPAKAAGSRIPIPKKSALPHLERDKAAKRENSPEDMEKQVDLPKTRPRSNSTALKSLDNLTNLKGHAPRRSFTADSPPKKQTPAATGPRKPSGPSKTIPPEARGKVRPKGKSGAAGSARPTTRSGDRELSPSNKPMEGEPPWLVSAYKPDPRLPPDQQLLPTVARRLQQEKWEQEGKFGNIYDKNFRPLTAEGFLEPPESMPYSASDDESKQEQVPKPEPEPEPEPEPVEATKEWPLKSPEPKLPDVIPGSSSPMRCGSYSTMPKIQDRPNASSPLASPRPTSRPGGSPELLRVTRVQDLPENEPEKAGKYGKTGKTGRKEKQGCGCCVVM